MPTKEFLERQRANAQKKAFIKADEAGRRAAGTAQRVAAEKKTKLKGFAQKGLASQSRRAEDFLTRGGAVSVVDGKKVTDVTKLSPENRTAYNQIISSQRTAQSDFNQKYDPVAAGYRGISTRKSDVIPRSGQSPEIGENQIQGGKLSREDKIAQMADLKASAASGGRIKPLTGGQTDEISRKFGAGSFGRRSVGKAGQFQALPGAISPGERARRSQITEGGERFTTQNRRFADVQQEAYDTFNPRESGVTKDDNEDSISFLDRKQKSRIQDLTSTIGEITRNEQQRQFDEFQSRNKSSVMSGGEPEVPTYERVKAGDETLEHNIRYKEDLNEFTSDVAEAKEDWINQQMLSIGVVGERERGILEKQLKLQADKKFKEKFDEGKKQLDFNLKRTNRLWKNSQDKAEAKFKKDALEDSQKSKADIENEIWTNQYEGYIAEGNSPVEARAMATRDLKIEKESDPAIQDMAGDITERIDSGLLQPDDSFDEAMMTLGDAKSARKSLELAGFTTGTINDLQENYQREVLGYDENAIGQSQFENTISDFYTGENADVYALGKFVRDAKTNLSDEFVQNQLRAISTSLSADQDVKNEATALLGEMGVAGAAREATRKSITKDKFGNIVSVDKITGEITQLGDVTPEQSINIDDPISTMARDVIEGNFSISEVEKFQGKEKARQVGAEVAKIRGLEQKTGKKLTGAELRKVSKELNSSDQFKSLTKALPTLDSLLAFEDLFSETGTELFGDQLNPLYRTALLEMKELFNLGVLNGPDLELMESIIPKPAGFGAQGPFRDEGIEQGIKIMKDKINKTVMDRLDELENLYGEFGADSLPALNNARDTTGKVIRRLGKIDEGLYSNEFLVDLTRSGAKIEDGKFFSPSGAEIDPDVLFQQFSQEESPIETTNTNLSRPERNKNPGNIKIGGIGDDFAKKDAQGKPMVDDQNHLIFETPQAGFNAMKADIKAKISGNPKKTRHSAKLGKNPTIATLNSVYATDPNWKNNVARYLNVDVNTKTSDINLDELIKAIINAEGGNKLLAQL